MKRQIKIQFGHLIVGMRFEDSRNKLFQKIDLERSLNLLDGHTWQIADKMRVYPVCLKNHRLSFQCNNSEIKNCKIFECLECDYRIAIFDINVKF